ncbi:MAG: PEGA domain-containing protein [Bacteroidales bacterium]|nr:PEGA domain-containing protein [Bacteroidales bacterium]
MKKLIIAVLAVFISINSFAQLEVKPGSFKEVTGFVNINDKQYDSNDNLYAVLKIRTENINDKERNELVFNVYDDVEYEVENQVGEVWLYVSYLANHITILHPEMGSAEFYLPFDMQGKKGYELTLVNITESETGQGSLWLNTLPENDATITINGKKLKVKTPYKNDMMAAGRYEITFSKERFQTVTITTAVYDGQNTHLDIEMPYMYGKMTVNSKPSGATVFIDDKERGTTPLNINDLIVSEKHELRIEKKGCKEFKSEFILEADKPLVVNANIDKNNCPKDALPGVFSVSEKKKVYFMKNESPSEWVNSNKNILSKAEWEYVLFKRNTKSGIRYVHANVGEVDGILLFPDDWNKESYDLNYSAKRAESNLISKNDEVFVLEAQGVVFLKNGEYWTSSGDAWDESTFNAFYVNITENEVVCRGMLVIVDSTLPFKKTVRLTCPAK